MSCESARPTFLNVPPPSVERKTPVPHEELLRPLPSPVPTQMILALPLFFSFSGSGWVAGSDSAGSSFQPGQPGGASAIATEPIDAVDSLSNTGEKGVPDRK